MSVESLAECAHYVLRRVNPDETEETVSEHPTFEEGGRQALALSLFWTSVARTPSTPMVGGSPSSGTLA